MFCCSCSNLRNTYIWVYLRIDFYYILITWGLNPWHNLVCNIIILEHCLWAFTSLVPFNNKCHANSFFTELFWFSGLYSALIRSTYFKYNNKYTIYSIFFKWVLVKLKIECKYTWRCFAARSLQNGCKHLELYVCTSRRIQVTNIVYKNSSKRISFLNFVQSS